MDFVIKVNHKIMAIEVKARENIRDDDFRSIGFFREEFPDAAAIVVKTDGASEYIRESRILIVPIVELVPEIVKWMSGPC